jgi:hypothetical protein
VTTKRLQGTTRLAQGGTRRVKFVNKVQSRATAYEEISQFHSFIRFISDEISREDLSSVNLVCIRVDSRVREDNPMRPGIYAFAAHRWIFEGLKTEEVVRARVLNLETLEMLGSEASIDIVNCARVFGQDWPGATGDVDAPVAGDSLEEIEFTLIDDFNEEKQQKESENYDRTQFQLNAIRTHLERKLGTEKQRIMNLGSDPRSRGLVIAAERTMQRLTERFDLQLAKLDQIRNIRSKREPVAKGMILIEGS